MLKIDYIWLYIKSNKTVHFFSSSNIKYIFNKSYKISFNNLLMVRLLVFIVVVLFMNQLIKAIDFTILLSELNI